MTRSLRAAVQIACALALLASGGRASASAQTDSRPPRFEPDRGWPTIPNNWVLGEVSSIAVDSHDRIWVLHRPRSVPAEQRANAAPPVLEFGQDGRLIASWGGPAAGYEWPEREHGIYVD